MATHQTGAVRVSRLTPTVRTSISSATIRQYEVVENVSTSLSNRVDFRFDHCLSSRLPQSIGQYSGRWPAQRSCRMGRTVLIPPVEPVLFHCVPGKTVSLECVLRPSELAAWLEEEVTWPASLLEDALDLRNARMKTLLALLATELKDPGFAQATVVELLSAQLAVEVARLQKDHRPADGTLAKWRLDLIRERLDQPGRAPTLAELAALCDTSVRQLTRSFRASEGCSIGTFVAQRRVEQAKQLLKTDLSIKAIARELGFATPASFAYAFSRAVGQAPRDYRPKLIRRSR